MELELLDELDEEFELELLDEFDELLELELLEELLDEFEELFELELLEELLDEFEELLRTWMTSSAGVTAVSRAVPTAEATTPAWAVCAPRATARAAAVKIASRFILKVLFSVLSGDMEDQPLAFPALTTATPRLFPKKKRPGVEGRAGLAYLARFPLKWTPVER